MALTKERARSLLQIGCIHNRKQLTLLGASHAYSTEGADRTEFFAILTPSGICAYNPNLEGLFTLEV